MTDRFVIEETLTSDVTDTTTKRTYLYWEVIELLNRTYEENQLLKDKLKKIDDILPVYLSCAEISDFHSKTFEEELALQKHYKGAIQ